MLKTAKGELIVSRKGIYNFSAGPSMMPESVLKAAQSEITGVSGDTLVGKTV